MKKIILKYFSKKVPFYVPTLISNLLDNRVALITGGSGGIGYSIAQAFLNSGAKVIITGRNKDKLIEACKLLECSGKFKNKIDYVVMDITKIDMMEAKLNEILNKYNKVDILVNNAGVSNNYEYGNISVDDYNMIIDTNLKGTYFLTQIVSNYMKKNNIHGNILNIASSSSVRPAITPYMISKWGIRGFTLGLAKKLIKDDIVVNGLAPGPTKTPMIDKENLSYYNYDPNPTGRYLTPEEVANMAVFLVGDTGKMIVGDIIYMTGGAGLITYDDVDY